MFKSGFVAILGRPNVGKSTLLNRMVGEKIAITSPVAQTTRHRIKGVITTEKGQVIFLDTPGFSKPLDQLGEYLTQEGQAALSEADCFLMLVDMSHPPGKGDQWVAEQIRGTGKFVLLALNKSDLVAKAEKREVLREEYRQLFEGYGHVSVLNISAKTGKNVERIPDTLIRKLPEGPAYYDSEALTDQRVREIAAEIIREKVLLNTQEEIPHSVAVGIDKFEETPDRTNIYSTLFVDQKSQKGIVIGKGGGMIKKIGSEARKDIETLLGQHVYLDLNVKVRENWRKDPRFLKSLGLAPPSE